MKMKVLIADDEKIIREGIISNVPWDKLDLEVIGSAKNGKEAYDILKNTQIDILISDIRMPYLTGLEIVEKFAKQKNPPTTILISGYDDFAYAQKAVEQKTILAYILKPLNLETLIENIKAAVNHRKKALNTMHFPDISDRNSENQQHNTREKAKEIFYSELLNESIAQSQCSKSMEIFDQMWNEFISNNYSLNFIKRSSWEIVLNIIRTTVKNGANANAFYEKQDPLRKIASFDDQIMIYNYIKKIIAKACGLITNSKTSISPLVNSAIAIISKNYISTNLNLKTLAEHLEVTPNYLGKIFKEQTGAYFSESLCKYRIEKSKQLLIATQLKIYQISDSVGFANVKHFTNTFKKITGSTPKDFRSKYYNV